MRTDTINVNGADYLLNVYYEKRNNTRASISRRSVNIRIPLLLSRKEQFKELLRMKVWAIKELQQNPKKFKQEIQKEYEDGDVLKIGDKKYDLKIEFRDKVSSSAKRISNTIYLVISSNLSKERERKHISSLLSRIIAYERLPELKEKIKKINEKHFNQEVNKIFFKNNKSNWGSCSRAGNVNISTRLLFAPDNVLEYVCVHELAHLIEQNHSNRFWTLVERVMPDYKERVNWLKENGDECRF